MNSEKFAEGIKLPYIARQIQGTPGDTDRDPPALLRAVEDEDERNALEKHDSVCDVMEETQPGTCWLGELPVNPFCKRVVDIIQA